MSDVHGFTRIAPPYSFGIFVKYCYYYLILTYQNGEMNFASCLVMVFEHALVLDSYQTAGSFMVRQRRGALCFDEDK